jgi:hypothetical protein
MTWTADEYAKEIISGRAFREYWIENYGEDPYTGQQVEPWEIPADRYEAAVFNQLMGILGGIALLCAIIGGVIVLAVRVSVWFLEMWDMRSYCKEIRGKDSSSGYRMDAH